MAKTQTKTIFNTEMTCSPLRAVYLPLDDVVTTIQHMIDASKFRIIQNLFKTLHAPMEYVAQFVHRLSCTD